MDALEAILTRRSIRKYDSRPVKREDIRDLLRAAMAAPSADNEQPWRFVVIESRKILDEIPKFHAYSEMLKQAKVAILVCADLELDLGSGMWLQDCSAATENILLAAHAMGLGAVWLGIYPVEERFVPLREMLGMPEHMIPFSLVALGYPSAAKPPADRFDPARVHYDRWGVQRV